MDAITDPINPPNQTLIRDLVVWLATEPRRYDDTMAAWRTSCPRLTVWEDACDLGLVERFRANGVEMVRATPKGEALASARPGLLKVCLANHYQAIHSCPD